MGIAVCSLISAGAMILALLLTKPHFLRLRRDGDSAGEVDAEDNIPPVHWGIVLGIGIGYGAASAFTLFVAALLWKRNRKTKQ